LGEQRAEGLRAFVLKNKGGGQHAMTETVA
jgi:hypothetical protein